MTTDKYQQQPRPYSLEERVKAVQADVSEIKNMVVGMSSRIDAIADTADGIHDLVKSPGEPKYNHGDEWDFLDQDE